MKLTLLFLSIFLFQSSLWSAQFDEDFSSEVLSKFLSLEFKRDGNNLSLEVNDFHQFFIFANKNKCTERVKELTTFYHRELLFTLMKSGAIELEAASGRVGVLINGRKFFVEEHSFSHSKLQSQVETLQLKFRSLKKDCSTRGGE